MNNYGWPEFDNGGYGLDDGDDFFQSLYPRQDDSSFHQVFVSGDEESSGQSLDTNDTNPLTVEDPQATAGQVGHPGHADPKGGHPDLPHFKPAQPPAKGGKRRRCQGCQTAMFVFLASEGRVWLKGPPPRGTVVDGRLQDAPRAQLQDHLERLPALPTSLKNYVRNQVVRNPGSFTCSAEHDTPIKPDCQSALQAWNLVWVETRVTVGLNAARARVAPNFPAPNFFPSDFFLAPYFFPTPELPAYQDESYVRILGHITLRLPRPALPGAPTGIPEVDIMQLRFGPGMVTSHQSDRCAFLSEAAPLPAEISVESLRSNPHEHPDIKIEINSRRDPASVAEYLDPKRGKADWRRVRIELHTRAPATRKGNTIICLRAEEPCLCIDPLHLIIPPLPSRGRGRNRGTDHGNDDDDSGDEDDDPSRGGRGGQEGSRGGQGGQGGKGGRGEQGGPGEQGGQGSSPGNIPRGLNGRGSSGGNYRQRSMAMYGPVCGAAYPAMPNWGYKRVSPADLSVLIREGRISLANAAVQVFERGLADYVPVIVLAAHNPCPSAYALLETVQELSLSRGYAEEDQRDEHAWAWEGLPVPTWLPAARVRAWEIAALLYRLKPHSVWKNRLASASERGLEGFWTAFPEIPTARAAPASHRDPKAPRLEDAHRPPARAEPAHKSPVRVAARVAVRAEPAHQSRDRAEAKEPFIISVFNFKGGVGKTTIALNLVSCLLHFFGSLRLVSDPLLIIT